jgi:hypothetical protein
MFEHEVRHLPGLMVAVSLAIGGVASADPIEINNPGGACVPFAGSYAPRIDGEGEGTATSGWTKVICPVERPVGIGLSGSFTAEVFVIAQNPGYPVWCRVASKNPGGQQIYGSWVNTNGTSAGYQYLGLTNSAGLTDPYGWSAFYLECWLPPVYSGFTSRIQMYRGILQ